MLNLTGLGYQSWRHKIVLLAQQAGMSVVAFYPYLEWWEMSSHIDVMLSLLYLCYAAWEV